MKIKNKRPLLCLTDSGKIVKLSNYWNRIDKNKMIVQDKISIQHLNDTTEITYTLGCWFYTFLNLPCGSRFSSGIVKRIVDEQIHVCRFDRNGTIFSDEMLRKDTCR